MSRFPESTNNLCKGWKKYSKYNTFSTEYFDAESVIHLRQRWVFYVAALWFGFRRIHLVCTYHLMQIRICHSLLFQGGLDSLLLAPKRCESPFLEITTGSRSWHHTFPKIAMQFTTSEKYRKRLEFSQRGKTKQNTLTTRRLLCTVNPLYMQPSLSVRGRIATSLVICTTLSTMKRPSYAGSFKWHLWSAMIPLK